MPTSCTSEGRPVPSLGGAELCVDMSLVVSSGGLRGVVRVGLVLAVVVAAAAPAPSSEGVPAVGRTAASEGGDAGAPPATACNINTVVFI